MNVLMLLTVGASLWILYVLFNAIIYGALTCATGLSGFYIGSCVQSGELFQLFDMAITSSGLVSFLLVVATFKFLSRFWEEAAIAIPRILNPFSRPAKAR
ncbi:MAG: hypothetical protein ACR2QF_00895 [Geminicoccaceae bacterium]